jgi:hypothetical protein
MRRVHAFAAAAWAVVAAGAGFGFVARDLLGLPAPAIACAWLAGALLGLRWRPRRYPL